MGFAWMRLPKISKDTRFPELPADMPLSQWFPYYAKGPHLHTYLQEMHQEVFSKYDSMNVGEASGISIDDALLFTDEDRNELQTFYHFDHTGFGIARIILCMRMTPTAICHPGRKYLTNGIRSFRKKAGPPIYLGNDDMSRMNSRFGSDHPAFRDYSAKMLHNFPASMRGTPYIYNGDEIGMTNSNHLSIEAYQDVYTINYYQQLKERRIVQRLSAIRCRISRE